MRRDDCGDPPGDDVAEQFEHLCGLIGERLTDRGLSSVTALEAFVASLDRQYGYRRFRSPNKINFRFGVINYSYRLGMPLVAAGLVALASDRSLASAAHHQGGHAGRSR